MKVLIYLVPDLLRDRYTFRIISSQQQTLPFVWFLPILRHVLVSKAFRSSTYENLPIKQTRWPLVRRRTIPTDRPPLVDEI
jgi:hypothetical protein